MTVVRREALEKGAFLTINGTECSDVLA